MRVANITRMSQHDVVATFTTDNKALADTIAAEIMADGLGCVQIEGPIRSTYRWHGQQHTDQEWHVEIETSRDRSQAVVDLIHDKHGTDVPNVQVTDNVSALTDSLLVD